MIKNDREYPERPKPLIHRLVPELDFTTLNRQYHSDQSLLKDVTTASTQSGVSSHEPAPTYCIQINRDPLMHSDSLEVRLRSEESPGSSRDSPKRTRRMPIKPAIKLSDDTLEREMQNSLKEKILKESFVAILGVRAAEMPSVVAQLRSLQFILEEVVPTKGNAHFVKVRGGSSEHQRLLKRSVIAITGLGNGRILVQTRDATTLPTHIIDDLFISEPPATPKSSTTCSLTSRSWTGIIADYLLIIFATFCRLLLSWDWMQLFIFPWDES